MSEGSSTQESVQVVRHEVHIVGFNVSTRDLFFLLLQLGLAAIPVMLVFGFLGYYAVIFLGLMFGSPHASSPGPW